MLIITGYPYDLRTFVAIASTSSLGFLASIMINEAIVHGKSAGASQALIEI